MNEKKPAASAPPHAEPAVPLKVVAIPEESGTFLVSGQRVTSPEDRAVLINGATTQEEWERLLRKIKATSIHMTAYKVAGEYAIYLSAPSADWDRRKTVFEQVRNGFRIDADAP